MKLRRPRSLNGLILVGFGIVALPLLLAVIWALVNLDRLADQSERIVFLGVASTENNRLLAEAEKLMERAESLHESTGGKQRLFDRFDYGSGENSDINWLPRGWDRHWKVIYYANSLVEGLKTSTAPEEIVKIADGEARFLRALAYFNLVWRQQRYQLIENDFLQYEKAAKIADLKYQSGESNLLSKVMMEAKYEELRLMLLQAESDKVAAQQELMKVIQSESLIEAAADTITKLEIDFNLDSMFSIYEGSSIMNYLNTRLLVSEQNIKVQKSSISPSLGLGYFNQSILYFTYTSNL